MPLCTATLPAVARAPTACGRLGMSCNARRRLACLESCHQPDVLGARAVMKRVQAPPHCPSNLPAPFLIPCIHNYLPACQEDHTATR